jgi:hypothetical protein
MSILDQYERQAVLLDEIATQREMNWDALGDMAEDMRLPVSVRSNLMRSREARLNGLREPRAAFGPFRQMMDGAIALSDQTAVIGTAETGLWPSAQYTGIAANSVRAGQVWYCTAFGVGTTPAASQGNITLTPRWGTSTGGTALGASAATALVASATNAPWQLEYMFVARTVGLAGANSTMVGSGVYSSAVALIAAATGNVVFGSTASVSVDLSIAAGLFMGITLGISSDSWKTLFVGLESLN